MDFSLFRQLADEISEMEPSPAVTISYEGESILNPDFSRMLEYLNEKKIRPWITIRAGQIGKSELRSIVEHCSAVSISMELDVTGISVPEKGFIDDMLVLNNSNGHDIEISVNHTLHPPHDIRSLQIINFIETWRSKVHEIYIWNKIEFGTSITHSHSKGIEKHLKRRRVCKQPFSFLAVLSDGRISPCCNTSRTAFKTINVSNGIAAAFRSGEYKQFLEDHENTVLGNYICRNCELWLDDWLGDEKVQIMLTEAEQVDAHLEGGTIRIEGALRKK
jgi:radical SAM protein with 4Fe4S-binding SPASM domain